MDHAALRGGGIKLHLVAATNNPAHVGDMGRIVMDHNMDPTLSQSIGLWAALSRTFEFQFIFGDPRCWKQFRDDRDGVLGRDQLHQQTLPSLVPYGPTAKPSTSNYELATDNNPQLNAVSVIAPSSEMTPGVSPSTHGKV